jgi:ubiquinone/menaquinone biosynthesis C-methylase UbiE
MDVVAFSRARSGVTVAEVGAGTGNFLALFDPVAARSIAIDLTPAMLLQARGRHPGLQLVAANGNALPLATGSIDLVSSAQALHHIPEPLPFLLEMRRVCSANGRILVVDQVAPERFEEAVAMSELETVRDPTHAVSRPPSALLILLNAAGLKIVDERIVSKRQNLRDWMWPEEFPAARIAAVREFIERRGEQTGMDWKREGDDLTYERRRIMLLAVPA